MFFCKKWPRTKNVNDPEWDDKNINAEQDLSGFSDEEEGNDEMEENVDVDYGSLLAELGFIGPNQKTLGPMFVSLLALGDENVWYLANGDGVISSKIFADTRIIAAFSGLASQNGQTIDLYLKTLCALIGTDTDACGSLIRLAMGDYSRLNVEIDKITRRIGAGVTKGKWFVETSTVRWSWYSPIIFVTFYFSFFDQGRENHRTFAC